jgi:hypothetical protein
MAILTDEALLDRVQRECLRYFWEFAHPVSFMARDRATGPNDPGNDVVAVGGTGMGVMAIVVGVERGWIDREAAVDRLTRMVGFLLYADHFHGVLPHFMNGATGKVVKFGRKDDGGDLVETSFLVQGLLTARAYFDRDAGAERSLRAMIDQLWHDVEWDWYARESGNVLTWHWSPNHGWALNHEIRGWNECLITYVLAAASPTHAIAPRAYHAGFAESRHHANGRRWHDIELPLGPPAGGPLFFTHYSFLGLDPRGLADRYADYWQQNLAHIRINRAHCLANPGGFRGYGEDCWGLSASDEPGGYGVHAPDSDNGVISPTAALSSYPYAPDLVMPVIRHFAESPDLWGPWGLVDAFDRTRNWVAPTHLAIDQAPIVVMIENGRSGLLWRLFMSCPEIAPALARLGFTIPKP